MKTILDILIATALIAGAFVLGRRTAYTEPQTIERIVVKVDTFMAVKPTPFAVYERDSILVPVHDTVRERDTLLLELPREVREYRDSNYFARVSGFRPALDYIETYNTETIVTRTERIEPPRLSFGIQAGLGAQYGVIGKSFDLGPYLGVGVQYRF